MFTGPSVPGLDGITPTLSLLYDSEHHRVRVMAGVQADPGDDDPSRRDPDPRQGGGDDDSWEIDLMNLPAEIQRLVEHRDASRSRTVRLSTPGCDALRRGGDFMSYEEYRLVSTRGLGAAVQRPGVRFNPLDPTVMRQAAMAAIYPPLTRGMFQQLVARCRGRRLFGM